MCGNTLVHDTLQATHSCSSQFSTHTSVVPHAQLHRTRLLYTALLATIGLSRSKPHYKGPPPLLPSCLNHTEGLTSAPDYTPAWDSKIHVAFYDTRRKPRIYDMRMAAALFNTTQVMFHVLLARPPQQPEEGGVPEVMRSQSIGELSVVPQVRRRR